MGLYDREYARGGSRRSGGIGGIGGAGSLRFMSFNTWLIVINIAVYVLDIMLRGFGVPVLLDRRVNVPIAPDQVIAAPVQRIASSAMTTQPGQRIPAGVRIERDLLNRSTGAVVGTETYVTMSPLQAYGHFSTAQGFFRAEVWRLVTFQFLHDQTTILHILFNMFGLYVFGGIVEQTLGFKRYAAFYLVCGIFGGLMYLFLNFLGDIVGLRLPGVLVDNIHTPLIGASAGVFGVIMACAYIMPNAVMQLIFPPIPIKMKVLAYGYVGIALLSLLMGARNAGGEAAHVGGALAGYFFIRRSHLLRDFFDIFGDSRRGGSGPRTAAGGGDPAEIDRILDKVHREGIASLSDREKAALSQDSRRRAR